jgi:hypothetical protein
MKAKPVQVSVYPQRFRRQQTMPVQIQTDVIRVIPKHLRKRYEFQFYQIFFFVLKSF